MGSYPYTCIELKFSDTDFIQIKTVCLDCRQCVRICQNLEIPPNAKNMQVSFITELHRCIYSVCNDKNNTDNGSMDIVERDVSTLQKQPQFPFYDYHGARFSSFTWWPEANKPSADELSAAGFFWTTKDDRVICFSCGGGLSDWDENDNPWEQHALHYGECEYIQLMKGSEYVAMVKEKFNKKEL